MYYKGVHGQKKVGNLFSNATLWGVMSRMRNGRSGSLMFVSRLCNLVSEFWLISRAFSASLAEPLTQSKNRANIINT